MMLLQQILLNKLQTHQHLALKTVLNVERRFSSSQLHANTGINWLDAERKERCCVETFRALHGMSSNNVNQLFVKSVSDKGLRSCNAVNFKVPVARTKLGDSNLPNMCEQYWRHVPDDVKNMTKLSTFKNALKRGNYFSHD